MNYRYGQVVKAWIGQSDEPFDTIFTECKDDDDRVIYSTKVCANTWVTPTLLHVTHVKRIEQIVRH